MQCRNAAKYPFNFRPLVCAAFGLGAGVAIGMHISGARALLAALLLLIAAYIMHAKKQRAAAVMLVCAAAGLLCVNALAAEGAERNNQKRPLFAQSCSDSAYANG